MEYLPSIPRFGGRFGRRYCFRRLSGFPKALFFAWSEWQDLRCRARAIDLVCEIQIVYCARVRVLCTRRKGRSTFNPQRLANAFLPFNSHDYFASVRLHLNTARAHVAIC